MKNITIFGREIIDEACIKQLENCVNEGDIGVMTPDGHYGYNMPIGGAVAYKNHVSISGVGFDIACGNKAVKTNIIANDINVALVMDEIFRRIGFGVGRPNDEPVDHPVFDSIASSDFGPQRAMLDLARKQLGTVGGGNHYVDLFEGEDGFLWVGVHFGSRGFGHKTATGFLALAKGAAWGERVSEGPMDGPPALLGLDTQLGQDYLYAMELAGEYAYAGRDAVCNKVLEILGGEPVFSVHNHHNFAWFEQHYNEIYNVVRKGCTPAFPNQLGFVGSSMLDTSVIVRGLDTEAAKTALYSTVHGAGRVMSRTVAAGKKKWIKDANGIKRPTIIAKGSVDFDEVRETMKEASIELRGAGADEAPQCYKKLDDVLGYMSETVEVVERLRPIGVAMAGSETYDPYKD